MKCGKCGKCGKEKTAYSVKREYGGYKIKHRCDKCSKITKDDTSEADRMTCP